MENESSTVGSKAADMCSAGIGWGMVAPGYHFANSSPCDRPPVHASITRGAPQAISKMHPGR